MPKLKHLTCSLFLVVASLLFPINGHCALQASPTSIETSTTLTLPLQYPVTQAKARKLPKRWITHNSAKLKKRNKRKQRQQKKRFHFHWGGFAMGFLLSVVGCIVAKLYYDRNVFISSLFGLLLLSIGVLLLIAL